MHDLTLMDFSQGGLGWLLENQLMWNNLVLLGGELHQFRGNPHYGMRRTEERALSSPLTPPSAENVPTENKDFHLLLDPKFPFSFSSPQVFCCAPHEEEKAVKDNRTETSLC